jgi:hypothetical protein
MRNDDDGGEEQGVDEDENAQAPHREEMKHRNTLIVCNANAVEFPDEEQPEDGLDCEDQEDPSADGNGEAAHGVLFIIHPS